MIVEIENIGLFEYAKANMDGLTVLAGINDTGKSTLGKVVFAIIYGLKEYKQEQEAHKDEQISVLTDELFFLMKRLTLETKTETKIETTAETADRSKIEEAFRPPTFIREIKEDLRKAIDSRINMVNGLERQDKLVTLVLEKLAVLSSLASKEKSKKELIIAAIDRALKSEFEGQISSRFNDKPARITFSTHSGTVLVKIDFKGDDICDLTIQDELLYANVTFIDSPIVMQLSHLISASGINSTINGASSQRSSVPLHWKDLNKKLVDSKYRFDFDQNPVLSALIGGKVEYDKDVQTFHYERVVDDHTFNVKAINVAAGIKSLSILNLLISSGHISIGSFLIIDEPEVNLHPQWQIEYAKVIASLAANGITVIVTTHSPYMIEALKTYEQMDDLKADFFLTKKSTAGIATIESHTHNISGIIQSLAAPLDELHQLYVNRTLDDL